MIVIVNSGARGGTAARALKSIEKDLKARWGDFTVAFTRSEEEVRRLVASKHAAGERRFVAAGGDGCVNALVQAVLTTLPDEQRETITLGAIGLGSSNDFHKPLSPDRLISGIPCTMDFRSARLRDVVKLEVGRNGSLETKHFLINASAGLTAEGNWFFNHPDRLLAALKRRWTGGAILYATIRSILTYRGQRLTIESGSLPPTGVDVTNLAMLKNPHVSGALKFPGVGSYDSGLLDIHLASNLGWRGRVRLFRALASGRAPEGPSVQSWQSQELTLSSGTPFALEFDGEVALTDRARVTVLPRHLRVCVC